MAKKGMSMNVAVALGVISVKPRHVPIIEISSDVPCKYSMSWHKDGLSAKDLYKMTKGHTEAVHREYRL